MGFFKPKICTCCNHKTYPVNDGKKVIWQNLLKIDIMSLFLIFGLISLLYGVSQINQQCYDIVEKPCDYLANLSCVKPVIHQEVIDIDFGRSTRTSASEDNGEGG